MAHPTEEDLKSLNRFWQWSDNEKPEPALFERKAGKDGPLTEEAQEALEYAYNVIEARDTNSMGMCSRAALKPLSMAILYAWMVLPKRSGVAPESLKVSADIIAHFPNVPAPKPPTLNAILGRLSDF